MKRQMLKFSHLVVVVAIIGIAVWVNAGDLNPPSGPISPTMKPLTDIEPRIAINTANTPGDADSTFRITTQGSYYLTGNLTGESGKSGIEIQVGVGNVTLDLNGFALYGISGSKSGIVNAGSPGDLSVKNGMVKNWGEDGVNLAGADYARVEDINASQNTGRGLVIWSYCTVTNCITQGNGSHGIETGGGSVITRCVAVGNGKSVAGDGIHAVALVGNSTIVDCTVIGNTGAGIRMDDHSTITRCTARQNADGIVASGGTITDCTVFENTGIGIDVNNASQVSGCTAYNNGGDGIRTYAGGHITGNNCASNGTSGAGAGIHATGNANRIVDNRAGGIQGIVIDGVDNHIEGNTVFASDKSFDVTGTGNIIIRNRTGQGNRNIVPGNAAAQFITGTADFINTDPTANFIY